MPGQVAGEQKRQRPPADQVVRGGSEVQREAAPATRRERAIGVGRIAALTAAASFVATSVFALSGLLFGELDWGVPELLRGIAASMLLDVGAALVVVPLVVRMLGLREAPGPAPDPAPDPTRDRTAAA